MHGISEWLRTLGLSEYAQSFAENYIDFSVLHDLTDQDLEKIGIPLGHRKKLLRAIAELGGAPLAASGTSAGPLLQDSAERRQLTVMFCDLVGSTALSARLDPEDLREVIGAYHRCCAEWVERSGGFVAKYMGDGILAYFGYPQAHEHDAERAVRTGLALAEAIPKVTVMGGGPLQVRVGIATGLVVVGDLIGAGAAQEQAVVGETPNLAARLQALAEPGAVMISSSTRELTGRLFEYRDLGAVALKGFAADVPAWQVLGTSAIDSRFEALRTGTTSLIGRDEEIDLLMRRWRQAKGGEGSVVLLSGEPGIGKSRITQTILEQLSGEPHTRLRYFCSPHHQDSALYPSIRQIERAAGFRSEDTAEERLAKLELLLARATDDLDGAVPIFATLLSVPTTDKYPPLNLSPQQRKERTLQAQFTQVEGLAKRQPVLMVWEDVHWSDATTQDSLDLLIDMVFKLRVLVIITFRPEFTPPWIGRPHVTLLSLSRLTPRQRAEMISQVTGGKPLPREVADQIIERTDGVPLFIEELTKTVVESGVLTDAGDRYTIGGPLPPVAIPTSLNASLLARLDRFAPTREVAQIAAALGRQFSHDLISAVATMPKQQLEDSLAQLVHAELVFRRGMPPEAEYTFKHALVQDAAYGTLLHSRRQQLHARITATLESRFPKVVETQPEVLARHCTEAGLLTKAVRYWLKAGLLAGAQSANAEAVSHLTKALGILRQWPDQQDREQQELEVQIALGPALIATKGYAAEETLAAYERARELIRITGDRTRQDAVLTGVFVCYYNLAAHEKGLEVGREFLQWAEEAGESVPLCIGNRMLAASYNTLGRFAEARHHAEQALSYYDPERHSPLAQRYVHDLGVAAMCHRAMAIWHLGYPEQSVAMEQEALVWATKLHHHNTTGYALFYAGAFSAFRRRDIGTLAYYVEKSIAHGREQGLPQWVLWGTLLRGPVLTAAGDIAEAIKSVEEAIGMADRMQSRAFRPMAYWILAEAKLALGDSDAALQLVSHGLSLAEHTHELWTNPELWRTKGSILLSIDDLPGAEACFSSGIDSAKQQGSRMFEMSSTVSLTRLWRDRGRRIEARNLLASIYGRFTEGFDAPVLKEAKALLDQLV